MARDFAKPFYNSKEWAKVRDLVLMRDHYKCTQCGDTGILEVHHIIHLNEKNINDKAVTLNTDNLRTLCRDCHFKEHAQDRKEAKGKESTGDVNKGYHFDENGFLVPDA